MFSRWFWMDFRFFSLQATLKQREVGILTFLNRNIEKSENRWFFVVSKLFPMFESPQNVFWGTHQNYKISAKFSGDLFFFSMVLSPQKLRFRRGIFWRKGPEATHSYRQKVKIGDFWPFSDTFLHLNRPKMIFLVTPQNSRISVKFSENLLFFFVVLGPPKNEKKQKKNKIKPALFFLLFSVFRRAKNQGKKKQIFWKFHRNSRIMRSSQKIIFVAIQCRKGSQNG